VQGLLTKAAELLIDLVAVMPERLDAIGALLCVEVALAEDRPRRLDTLRFCGLSMVSYTKRTRFWVTN
jgi:hypothetical protein